MKRLGLLAGLAAKVAGNEFLERLEELVDWAPLWRELAALFTATPGRWPRPPLVVFKRRLLPHCYGLSDPQCEELVGDRRSWRRFAGLGLGLDGPVPDETTPGALPAAAGAGRPARTPARPGQRTARSPRAHPQARHAGGRHAAAGRAPRKDDPKGGDPAADHTVKHGQPHHGFKAPVAVDEEHTAESARPSWARPASTTAAASRTWSEGTEQRVVADKACWSRERSAWLAERSLENGLLRRGARNRPLGEPAPTLNRFLRGVRARTEQVFGHWKRALGYRRGRYLGCRRNRLEREFKGLAWNLKRWVHLEAAA